MGLSSARTRLLRVTGAGAAASILWAGCGGGTPLDELLPSFRSELTRLAQDAKQRPDGAVIGVDGWHFHGPELANVGAPPRRPDAATRTVLDVKAQLDSVGVELLLVPIPSKSIIFPEKVASELEIPIPVPRFDPELQAVYETLRAAGVEVLDLTRRFIRERFHPEGPLFCRTDRHWSGTGCTEAASAIGEWVRDRAWFDELTTEEFGAAWYSTTIEGDLATTDTSEREELRLRGIVRSTTEGPVSPAPDRASPIILLGDRHSLVFHSGVGIEVRGAGLPEQLAFELGAAVDLVAEADDLGTARGRQRLSDRAGTEEGFWASKRLVIWCFASSSLANDQGWTPTRLVPEA
ncbi:MAG: hypothetical protein CL483_05250 [Acidobacteria bacterium]|nr:hypothetical protein [Acidobacteriota bacterium]|tara:strand:- start:704 stop:1753 length:1050 start_codon:yes stop_codon:yes gene_type:complete